MSSEVVTIVEGDVYLSIEQEDTARFDRERNALVRFPFEARRP